MSCAVLRRIPSFGQGSGGRDVVVAFRKKVQILGHATDERDLRAMRSLNFEKLKGDRAGQHSVRLNGQFRLILSFRAADDGRVVVVLALVDYH